MNQVKHITQSISADPKKVYDFASNPENLPQWAGGLSSTITKSGNDWVADSPMGKVKVRFAEKNSYGILDHDVTLPNGQKVHNPLRVIPAIEGSEVVFTLFKLPGVSDADFNADAGRVASDLKNLKKILEQ